MNLKKSVNKQEILGFANGERAVKVFKHRRGMVGMHPSIN